MLPAFLITFREVIEATLIVATILGILVKLKQTSSIKTVWYATASAVGVSVILLVLGSLAGFKLQELYTGKTEEIIEGIFMIVSAAFITWAVFVLHKYFASYKTSLLNKVSKTIEHKKSSQRNLFILVFTAVFREGFEIVLFLTTIYLSTNPASIFTGFISGLILALIVSYMFFSATFRLPVYYAFRLSSILLILFAAGLLARGVHEFAEAQLIPELYKMTSIWIPDDATITGGVLKSMFGITKHMDLIQLSVYVGYIAIMAWFVFIRPKYQESEVSS